MEAIGKTHRKVVTPSFIVTNVLFVALLVAITIPGKAKIATPVPFYVATVLIEALYLWRFFANDRKPSTNYIAIVVWALLIAWEVCSTILKITHPVLIPNPENVFNVFPTLWPELTRNIYSSLQLVFAGYFSALILGNVIGLFVGWLPKLRDTVYPIARVCAPIPAIVFAPYLIMLMPNFRSAAIMAIFLGIFWPTLLNAILRVGSMDRRIVESARMMGLSTPQIIFQVFVPYTYPAIATGMKVQMATAMLMLVMAEMYGATSGMGYFVLNYTNYGNYTNVVAGIICVGLVVTVLDCLISLLIKKTVKWSE
ncbi:MAG: ABC transporter permease subunit [Coriobacteriia bacterium]|nr:ABC transporter permease subunit [Coriobacteriia bacterium]